MIKITNKEYLKAIDGSIDKWTGIVEEKYDPASGRTRCALCELCDKVMALVPIDTRTNSCGLCPLTEMSQRCGYAGSTWARYVDCLLRQARRPAPLDLTPKLESLAEEMLNILKEVRKKYEK